MIKGQNTQKEIEKLRTEMLIMSLNGIAHPTLLNLYAEKLKKLENGEISLD